MGERAGKTSDERFTSALVLVPTRELSEQVHKAIGRLAAYCGKHIRSVNLAQNISEQVQQFSFPTPSRHGGGGRGR